MTMTSRQAKVDPLVDLAARLDAEKDTKTAALTQTLSSTLDGSVIEIALADLSPDPFQPRKAIDGKTIAELAESLFQHGLLQPLVVRPAQGPNTRGRYWILAGQRRYLAAQKAGLDKVPCTLKNFTNTQSLVAGLVENVHREDLTEIDKAEALVRLKQMTSKTWDGIADLVKLSREHVKRIAALVNLQEEVKELGREGKLSMRQLMALSPAGPVKQVELAQQAVAQGLSAEDIRSVTTKLAPPAPPRKTSTAPPLVFTHPATEEEDVDAKSSATGDPVPTYNPQGGMLFPGESPLHAVSSPVQSSPAPRPDRRLEGPVVNALKQYTGATRQVISWLDSRDWSPSRVSENQSAAIEEFYHAASELQQRLAIIRRDIKKSGGGASDADRLKDIDFSDFLRPLK